MRARVVIMAWSRGPALYTMIAVAATSRCARIRAVRRMLPHLPHHLTRPSDVPPAVAQINLAALRSNLAQACARRRRGAQVLAVVKANAYGHGLMRVLPALDDADGLALVELDAASSCANARYTRRILLLEGFFDGVGAARDSRSAGSRPSCTTRSRCGCSRSAVLVAAARGLRQGQHRHEPARAFGPADVARRVPAPARSSPSVAALRLMMHFARADEDDGIDEPLAGVRGRLQGPALSALARQLRGRHPLRRGRRRHRPARHHALRRVAVSSTTPPQMLGLAARDDAALAASSRCRT